PPQGPRERLDALRRLELASPDLPPGGNGERAHQPDGIADSGVGGERFPPPPLSFRTAAGREGGKNGKSCGDERATGNGPLCRRATWLHRFSRRARSAKA